MSCPRPLVLFFDEIDARRGDGLRSVLSQLRDGFPSRPEGFPASVVLCGLQHTAETGQVFTQLVVMGYLHRIVNGGGYIDREYGTGRGAIDVLDRWPYKDDDGKRAWQQEAMELKVWRPGEKDPLGEGLEQLDRYLDRLGLDQGTLIVFDRRPDAEPIAERTRFSDEHTPSGRSVNLLRA